MYRHYNIINCGDTGTGKTITCDNVLNSFPEVRYLNTKIIFNAKTTSSDILDLMNLRLKKRKMNVLGPENNKKTILFIDDLNMPQKEVFGSQPPLELIRQLFSNGGWYDFSDFEFKYIVDVYIMSAMGIPGGGRSIINPRIVR